MAGAVTLNLRAVDNVSPALKKANASAKTFNKTVNASKGKLDQAKFSLWGFGAAAKGAGGAAVAATPGILGMGAAMQKALGPIALVTGGIGALAAAISTLANLDEASAKFASLGGDADALKAKLQGVVEELDNSVNVVELMAASYDVASAGFKEAGEATKILRAAALGAKGGFSDLTTTGGALVKVMNAYGFAADDAGTLMDKFVQTQNDGIITVDQYSQGIGKVASVASMLKVPLEEVNAAIALSTKAGVNSEVAFTGMKTALLRLTGSRGAKKLEKLGIDISAATIEANGFAAELKKLEGMDIKVLEQIFGQEAIQTMAPVLNNMREFERLIKNQENAVGTAKDAHDGMAQTMKGAWTELTNIFVNTTTKQSALTDLITLTIQITTQGLKLILFLLDPLLTKINELLQLIVDIGNAVKDLKNKAGDWINRILGRPEGETGLDKANKNVGEIKTKIEQTKPPLEENLGIVDNTNVSLNKQKSVVEELQEVWEGVGQTIQRGVTDSIMKAIQGGESLRSSMSSVLNQIANQALQVAINMALWGGLSGSGTGGIFGWLTNAIFGRASGGPVSAGKPYIVGERGPELFVPSGNGRIDPNGSGGGSINTTVNVDASGSSVEGDEETGKELGNIIAAAVQSEIAHQQMPGGLLYS